MAPRRAPALLLLLLITACSVEIGTSGTSSLPEPAAATLPGAGPGLPAGLLEVVDGDTLLASFQGAAEEVRLLGINAPEHDECFGDRSRAALEGLAASAPLRLDPLAERDQFGRLLAYAYAGDTLVNLALVEGGFALAMHEDHVRRDEFLAAGEAAYAAGRGLWSADACGTPPAAGVTLLEIEANPPGPDEDDLNGEWVVLENRRAADADLTGWVLRDESSEHRYHFPARATLPAGGPLRVFVGCGTDRGDALYWCADGPVWNNGGDTALLLDPQGNVVDRLAYP